MPPVATGRDLEIILTQPITITDRRLSLMYGAGFAAAGMIVIGSIVRLAVGGLAPVGVVDIVGLAVLAVFASRFMPQLRIGGARQQQSLTDFTIIFGLMVVPGPWMIVLIAAATTIGKSLARFPVRRIALNTSKDVITTFVAAVAGWLCALGSPFMPTADRLGRIIIVALIAIATDEAISVPAVALSNGQRARDVWAAYAPARVTMATVRMACGIAAGYLLASDRRLALVMPLIAIALHLAYTNRLQQRVDRLAWSRLSQLVDAVKSGDPQTVRLAAVHGTAELFGCTEVDLVLRSGSTDVLLRGDARNISYAGPIATAPERRGWVIVAPLGDGDPANVWRGATSNGATTGATEAVPDTGDAREPDHGPAGSSVGELRLRFLMPATFTEQEQHTLQALSAALGTAVRKSNAISAVARLATDQAHAASLDPLTGLANRRYLLEHGMAAIARRVSSADSAGAAMDSANELGAASGAGSQLGPNTHDGVDGAAHTGDLVALVVIDLIGFKQINDALGQAVGDQVLVAAAQRLADHAAPADLIARLSGDEFAALLAPVASTTDAVSRARDLVGAIAQPLTVDGVRLDIAATSGVAVDTTDTDIGELLRRADVAVAQAVLDGQPVSSYAATRDTADVNRLVLGADLTRAVARREFTIAFQPIVDLESGIVRSAEALARWPHPQLGQLSPHQFLDGVERSGLLGGFTEHILDQALAGAREWTDAGFEIPVAVNVSPRSLLDGGFPALVSTALDRYHLPPSALIIELTETLMLSNVDTVDEVLHTLREIGVMLALDDFGTGYSSLATVARVPVDELKIDRTFVAGLAGPTEGAIVRTTIELGRGLGILVVAEGIESHEQRERLWALGCAAGQGHLFSRPVPAERLIARLRRGHEGVPGRLVAPMHGGDVIRLPATRRPADGWRDEAWLEESWRDEVRRDEARRLDARREDAPGDESMHADGGHDRAAVDEPSRDELN